MFEFFLMRSSYMSVSFWLGLDVLHPYEADTGKCLYCLLNNNFQDECFVGIATHLVAEHGIDSWRCGSKAKFLR